MVEDFQGKAIAGRGDAESIAIQVLGFIVSDIDRTVQFLNITGLQPETIRESAKQPLFLVGVLDYVSKDDELLRAIHKELGIWPATVLAAAVHLSPEPERKLSDTRSETVAPDLPRRHLFH